MPSPLFGFLRIPRLKSTNLVETRALRPFFFFFSQSIIIAKDGGIQFSKTGGGWGEFVPPLKKNDFNSEPVDYSPRCRSCLMKISCVNHGIELHNPKPQLTGVSVRCTIGQKTVYRVCLAPVDGIGEIHYRRSFRASRYFRMESMSAGRQNAREREPTSEEPLHQHRPGIMQLHLERFVPAVCSIG